MKQVFYTDLNEMNKLMIYFAHSTLCIYSKTIKCEHSMSINDFRNQNETIIKRVYEEAKSIFNYELSSEQISKATHAYFISKFNPIDVLELKSVDINRY
jgi:hypothetical protein